MIQLIRGAADTATAKNQLVGQFDLSLVQAEAILQMQLRRLTALEADKIQAEHEELQERIADLNDILARRERIEAIIEEELNKLKEIHATPRRTEITKAEGEIQDMDLIANEQAIILVTEQGYIKRMPVDTFGSQSRATRGKSAHLLQTGRRRNDAGALVCMPDRHSSDRRPGRCSRPRPPGYAAEYARGRRWRRPRGSPPSRARRSSPLRLVG